MKKCPPGVDPQSCPGCDPGENAEKKHQEKEEHLAWALKRIRHKLLVMSGKGGVGKSNLAVNLALGLARRGHRVGLMDVDMHGPNVLRMLGLKEPLDLTQAQFQLPPDLFENLRVISIEVLMRNREMAVIWRGPLKHQLIRQFLTEVQWGALDYLVIDAPPGTGDEPLSVAQNIPDAQAIIVTTPQEISLADVRKSINFCQQLKLNILGLVENMSGYRCPHCGQELPLFKRGGGERTARAAKVPFLGALPFDPGVVEAADQGELMQLTEADSPFLKALRPLVDYLLKVLPLTSPAPREPGVLKLALPVEDGRLSEKFAQAQQFALITVKDHTVTDRQLLKPPPPEYEALPQWLEELGVTHVIVTGMGDRGQTLLNRKGIEVITGAPQEEAELLVNRYLPQILAAPPAGLEAGKSKES